MSSSIQRAFKSILAASAALVLVACGGPLPDEGGEINQAVKQVIPCGGFAGIACPDGMECVDAPGDHCKPDRGDADCAGVCKARKGGKKGCKGKPDPSKTYVAYGDQCNLVRFFCEPGSEYFRDNCGCGCQTTQAGEACGNNVCGPGTYCCNASCGICAPLDGVCIQLACAP